MMTERKLRNIRGFTNKLGSTTEKRGVPYSLGPGPRANYQAQSNNKKLFSKKK